ncbi:hypothetical protein LZK77_31460 (plasmid) [Rhizobium leguminosarum]|nr:hypothetical protein LZK77_31460 [Rhizobium leguminosarum]
MKENGIAPIAYSSLAPLSTWRAQPGQDSAKTEAMKISDGVLAAMAAKYGVTEAQLLLRWGCRTVMPFCQRVSIPSVCGKTSISADSLSMRQTSLR